MTLDDLTSLLSIHGGDFDRWPEGRAAEARALVAADPRARRAWESARRLDDLFVRDRLRADDPARDKAIIDQALRRIRNQPARISSWRWLVSRPVGAMLAGTLLAGWLAGALLDPPAPREAPALSVLFGGGGGGLEGVM